MQIQGVPMKSDYRTIIDYWPTYASLAGDLGVTPDAIKQMRRRNRIPAHHWLGLIRSAEQNDFPEITLEQLATLAEQFGPK